MTANSPNNVILLGIETSIQVIIRNLGGIAIPKPLKP